MIDRVIVDNLLLVLIDVLGLWLAGWVYLSNRKDKVNLGLSLMIVTILFWINFYHFGVISSDESLSHHFFKIAGASVFVFFIAYYFFVVRWFSNRKGLYKILGYVTLVYGVLFAFITFFTDLIITNPQMETWGSYPVFSRPGWYIFYGYVGFLTLVIILTSINDYMSAEATRKRKIKFFLFGILTFTALNLAFNVFAQIFFNNYKYYQIGNYSTIILIGFTLYAIVKHELFNIKVVTAQVLTVIIWIILFSRLFVSRDRSEIIINFIALVLMTVFGILLVRSISREVKQRRQLQLLAKELKTMSERKDEFISMAAHELRAPITAVKGYMSMIMEGDAGEIPDTVSEYLEDAIVGSDRMIRLVNNMLNVSRIKEGRMVYQAGTVNLMVVANSVATEFREEAQRKNLSINIIAPDDLLDRVFVDQDRIYEVVGNLVGNAVKYTDHGSIIINMLNPNKATIRLEVIDTGTGISQEEQKKLFQKFERAESSIGKTIGTGLGLYISRLLVERFGGKIGLVSIPGKGSNFWFDLPLNYQTTD